MEIPAGQPPVGTRREFMGMAAGLAAGATRLSRLGGAGTTAPPAHRPLTGYRDYTMAMHVHSCFSEGKASMQAQLSEAYANGIDVVWWTEHDWRMNAHGYRDTVHFDSLTQESEAGRPWHWEPHTIGQPASVAGGIVSSPVSPRDPSTAGALHVQCRAAPGSAPVSYRYYGNASQARLNQRTNITGQRIHLEAMPATIGPDAWLEVLLVLSYRPALQGRPVGQYQLSYRLGTAAASHGVDSASPSLGVVTRPVTPGSYQSIVLDPTADVAAIWPDLVAPGDNGLVDIWLGATARNGATADGFFDFLVFSRSQAPGDAPLAVQAGLMTALGPDYPQMAQYAAQEASYFDQHMNLYAGDQHLYPYAQYPNVWSNSKNPAFATYLADLIHTSGGLCAFNHPFGPSQNPVSPSTDQDALRHKVTAAMLTDAACHADAVELGFRQRGGATLETHLALGDSLWRNGLWLTATGVNDNHNGGRGDWFREANRFVTSTWCGSAAEADLVDALAAGRAFVGELGSWAGTLDLTVDGVAQMGSVSVRPSLTSRTATVAATQVPTGSVVELVQGPVDYAGTNDLDPRSRVVATIPAAAFGSGAVSSLVDTSTSCFVRACIVLAGGRRVAFTNPIWLLHEAARTQVPAARVSPDSL